MSRTRPLILACLAILLNHSDAEETLASGASGSINWSVTSPLSYMPSNGFVPVTVNATNTGIKDSDTRYDFKSRDDFFGGKATTLASGVLAIPAKQSRTATHWVWRSSNLPDGYGQDYVNFSIGAGSGTSVNALRGAELQAGQPRVAVSRSFLKGASMGLSASGNGNYEIYGTTVAVFDPKSLPADWRVFSSMHKLYLAPSDWDDFSPGVRDALRTWIGLGGRVRIVDDNDAEGARVVGELLPDTAVIGVFAGSKPVGVISKGNVSSDIDGTDLSGPALSIGIPGPLVKETGRRMRGRRMWDDEYTDSRRSDRFPLRDAFGRRDIPYLVICVVLIIFAVLVGPVSLRLWAGPGRRHRLFFTTPALSIATSGMLLLVMLFQDGLGMSGRRFTLLDLAPADSSQPAALVYQEQFTRAGMIGSGGFALAEGLVPVVPPEVASEGLSLAVREGRAVGSWFSSRRDTSLALAGSTPVRWKVTHEDATEDNLRLRIESPLTEFEAAWFVDGAGLVWKWDNAAPGADGELGFIPASRDADGVMEPMFGHCSQALKKVILAQMGHEEQRNRFWALVKDGSAAAIETNPKIRWKESQLVLTSKVTPAK